MKFQWLDLEVSIASEKEEKNPKNNAIIHIPKLIWLTKYLLRERELLFYYLKISWRKDGLLWAQFLYQTKTLKMKKEIKTLFIFNWM